MKEEAEIDHFEDHLKGEDGGEDVVEVLEHVVLAGGAVDGVFGGERERRKGDDCQNGG